MSLLVAVQNALSFVLQKTWIDFMVVVFALLLPFEVGKTGPVAHLLYVIAITAAVMYAQALLVKKLGKAPPNTVPDIEVSPFALKK